MDKGLLEQLLIAQEWLWANVAGKDGFNYQWSSGDLRTTFVFNNGAEISLSNNLRFKHEEDLAAFKLVFGVHNAHL